MRWSAGGSVSAGARGEVGQREERGEGGLEPLLDASELRATKL